jgi:hypothetical protein
MPGLPSGPPRRVLLTASTSTPRPTGDVVEFRHGALPGVSIAVVGVAEMGNRVTDARPTAQSL